MYKSHLQKPAFPVPEVPDRIHTIKIPSLLYCEEARYKSVDLFAESNDCYSTHTPVAQIAAVTACTQPVLLNPRAFTSAVPP
jgi:hypothetical protein